MVIHKYNIKAKQGATVRIWPLGDLHAGTIFSEEAELRKCIDIIRRDPNAYWIGTGDYAECIVPNDPRWEPSQSIIAPWVKPDNVAECERRMVLDILDPIRKKCIGLLYGNHENKIRKRCYYNFHENLCADLSAKNLGYTCFIHFVIEATNTTRYLVKGCFTHGAGGATTKASKLNKLIKFMTARQADIYGYAHVHDILPARYKQLATTRNLKLYEKRFIGYTTGSWLRTYAESPIASYGEEAGYDPVSMGCPVYLIKDGSVDGEVYEI